MSNRAWCNRKEYASFKARLVALDGGKPICYYCRRAIDLRLASGTTQSYTIDHLKPRSLYPELAKVFSNMVSAHKSCNSSKNTQTVEKTLADMARRRRGTRTEWTR